MFVCNRLRIPARRECQPNIKEMLPQKTQNNDTHLLKAKAKAKKGVNS